MGVTAGFERGRWWEESRRADMLMWDIGQKARDRERWEIVKYFLYLFAIIQVLAELVAFQKGFYLYHIRPSAYEVREVTIVRAETEIVTVPGPRGSHRDRELPIYRAVVEYEVQGVKFSRQVLRKRQEKQGDTIKVAINKVEPGKVIRPEFLIVSPGHVRYTVFCIVILSVLILIDVIIAYKERKKGYVISITTSGPERK